MRFERGNTIGKAGRPKGTKNKLAATVLRDLLAVWEERVKPDSEITRGVAALRIMSKDLRSLQSCTLPAYPGSFGSTAPSPNSMTASSMR